jgi:hypothetical protein
VGQHLVRCRPLDGNKQGNEREAGPIRDIPIPGNISGIVCVRFMLGFVPMPSDIRFAAAAREKNSAEHLHLANKFAY